jgi:hypothetical protein
LKDSLKKDVMRAFKHAESLKRHELKEVFSDVYAGEEPLNLVGVPYSSPPTSASPASRMLRWENSDISTVLTEGTTGGTHPAA